MALHFHTFDPAMKDHLSHKTIFCGLLSQVLLYVKVNEPCISMLVQSTLSKHWDLLFGSGGDMYMP